MINKTNLWFLTLSSIILVLAVYYIAIPRDTVTSVFKGIDDKQVIETNITESEALTAMRVSKEEEMLETMQTLQEVLLNSASTVEQKNEAYEQIQYLNTTKANEERLENLINKTYKVTCFIQMKDNKIKVVIANTKESKELANNIMNTIKKELNEDIYVTVKFE